MVDTFRVHLPPLTADWVVEHGGLDRSQLVHKNAELFDAQERAKLPLFLTPSAARELQNGAVMARLLGTLFRKNGAESPVSPDALAPGTEAVVVLRNWKDILLPVLRATFVIELSADKLALLVGGDSEVLTLLVETVCKRATGVQVLAEDSDSPPLLAKLAKRFDADVMDNIYLAANLMTGARPALLVRTWRAPSSPAPRRNFLLQACMLLSWRLCSASLCRRHARPTLSSRSGTCAACPRTSSRKAS